MGTEEVVKVTVYMPKSLHRRFRFWAEPNMNAVLIALATDYAVRHEGVSEVKDND